MTFFRKAIVWVCLLLVFVAAGRSSSWSKVRAVYLKQHPACEACGGSKDLSVHHIVPFHVDKSKELEQSNLITLCNYHRCHLMVGHLGDWSSYNPYVRQDAERMLSRIHQFGGVKYGVDSGTSE